MTSTKHLLRQARKLYNVPDVPASTNRHNQKSWVRSVMFLGDKWHLRKFAERRA